MITSNHGYSLIEVLVAGILLSLVIVSIYAVTSQGVKVDAEGTVRRAAFLELERILESPEYASSNYSNLADSTLPSVVLLDRDANNITATPTVAVTSVSFSGGGVANIPAKRVRASIIWTSEGVLDSVWLEKLVTLITANN